MSRAGADRYRDLVNTPAFLDALPDVDGPALPRRRLRRGTQHAPARRTRRRRDGARHLRHVHPCGPCCRSARSVTSGATRSRLPFATANLRRGDRVHERHGRRRPVAVVLGEIVRVLRSGRVVAVLDHPSAQHHPAPVVGRRRTRRSHVVGDRRLLRRRRRSRPRGRSRSPARLPDRHDPFTITAARRTVSSWINLVIDAGLTIERVIEPVASESTASRHPDVADTRIVPFFLIVRARR